MNGLQFLYSNLVKPMMSETTGATINALKDAVQFQGSGRQLIGWRWTVV
jgi:hypothetical protein